MTSESYRSGPDGVAHVSVIEGLKQINFGRAAREIGSVMITGFSELMNPDTREIFVRRPIEPRL